MGSRGRGPGGGLGLLGTPRAPGPLRPRQPQHLVSVPVPGSERRGGSGSSLRGGLGPSGGSGLAGARGVGRGPRGVGGAQSGGEADSGDQRCEAPGSPGRRPVERRVDPGPPGRWQASLDWVGATPGPQAPSRASGNRASTGRGVPGSAPWAPGSQGLWEQRPGVPKPRRAVCLPGVSAPPLSPAGNSQAPREPGRPEAATSCRPELSGSLSCASLGSSWFY